MSRLEREAKANRGIARVFVGDHSTRSSATSTTLNTGLTAGLKKVKSFCVFVKAASFNRPTKPASPVIDVLMGPV